MEEITKEIIGEIFPGFNLSYFDGRLKIYEIGKLDIFTFGYTPKPRKHYQGFMENGTPKCYSGFHFDARTSTKGFLFSPELGSKILKAVKKAGWNKNKLAKELNEEMDLRIWVYQKAALMVEKYEDEKNDA